MSLSMSYIEHIQSPTLTRGNIHMYYMYTYIVRTCAIYFKGICSYLWHMYLEKGLFQLVEESRKVCTHNVCIVIIICVIRMLCLEVTIILSCSG